MGWARQKKGLAWILLGMWCVLTGLMALWAARPAYFAEVQAAAVEYPWLGLLVLSLALAMLFVNEYILFTGRLSKQRPVLAVCILSLLPLLMFVFAAFISMHAPDYVGLFIQTVVCINVLHFSAGMVWVWWRYRQQGIGFK
jgi:hypothetical protein